jgi:uncharacterized protein (TIGR02001 family)
MGWHRIFLKHSYLVVALVLGAALLVVPYHGMAEEVAPEVPQKIKEAEAAKKEEDRPQFSLSVDILSQYVWRGVAFSRDSAVFQPSVTVSYKGFAANIWGNFDTNEKNPFGIIANRKDPKWNETDFTVSYSRELFKDFSVTGGVIYYALDGNNSTDDSVEIFGAIGYKIPRIDVGVGCAVYREVSHFPGWYLEWYLTRSFPLPFAGASLDLYASWSAEISEDRAVFPTPDGSKYQGLHAGQLRVAVNFPVTKHITISPKIIYWYALGGDSTFAIRNLSWDGKHNHILGGVSIAATF